MRQKFAACAPKDTTPQMISQAEGSSSVNVSRLAMTCKARFTGKQSEVAETAGGVFRVISKSKQEITSNHDECHGDQDRDQNGPSPQKQKVD